MTRTDRGAAHGGGASVGLARHRGVRDDGWPMPGSTALDLTRRCSGWHIHSGGAVGKDQQGWLIV